MDILNEVQKEEDLYYKGPFWVVSNSVRDIQLGNFKIVGEKYVCDYYGKLIDLTHKNNTHKKLWKSAYAAEYGHPEENYYPRGRIEIYNGEVFIHIHSICNTPKIINAIIEFYDLDKLKDNITIELNDETQSSHYDFLLK